MLTRPYCLLEVWCAWRSGVPICVLEIVDSGFSWTEVGANIAAALDDAEAAALLEITLTVPSSVLVEHRLKANVAIVGSAAHEALSAQGRPALKARRESEPTQCSESLAHLRMELVAAGALLGLNSARTP